jgi:hypothetical protein
LSLVTGSIAALASAQPASQKLALYANVVLTAPGILEPLNTHFNRGESRYGMRITATSC